MTALSSFISVIVVTPSWIRPSRWYQDKGEPLSIAMGRNCKFKLQCEKFKSHGESTENRHKPAIYTMAGIFLPPHFPLVLKN